jgi:hypothetical protein
MSAFQIVNEDEPQQQPQAASNQAAQKMLLFALSQLGKRAVAGLSAAFSLIGLGSVWALWYSVLGQPSPVQLTGIGMYSIFLLCLEVIRRKM